MRLIWGEGMFIKEKRREERNEVPLHLGKSAPTFYLLPFLFFMGVIDHA